VLHFTVRHVSGRPYGTIATAKERKTPQEEENQSESCDDMFILKRRDQFDFG